MHGYVLDFVKHFRLCPSLAPFVSDGLSIWWSFARMKKKCSTFFIFLGGCPRNIMYCHTECYAEKLLEYVRKPWFFSTGLLYFSEEMSNIPWKSIHIWALPWERSFEVYKSVFLLSLLTGCRGSRDLLEVNPSRKTSKRHKSEVPYSFLLILIESTSQTLEPRLLFPPDFSVSEAFIASEFVGKK